MCFSVSGGELFDHVCANEYLDEQEASAFIKQILYGIQHLHRNHVVHMDIKPENIMLRIKNASQIKIIDFGLSRIILPGSQVKEMVGTPEFVAPGLSLLLFFMHCKPHLEVVNYETLSSATDMYVWKIYLKRKIFVLKLYFTFFTVVIVSIFMF